MKIILRKVSNAEENIAEEKHADSHVRILLFCTFQKINKNFHSHFLAYFRISDLTLEVYNKTWSQVFCKQYLLNILVF